MTKGSTLNPEARLDAPGHDCDQASATTMTPGIQARLSPNGQSSDDAGGDRERAASRTSLPTAIAREDAVPLLGLEPPAVEKAGENSNSQADPASPTCYAPLLGTILSQSIENAGGSSERRSPESVCHDKLLRESGRSLGRKSQKTVRSDSPVCYGIHRDNFGFGPARPGGIVRPRGE